MTSPSKNIIELEEELMDKNRASFVAGIEWAEAKSKYEELEDFKKTVKSNAMPNEGPQGLRETEAEKSEAYITHLKGMSAARLTFLKAEVKYNSLKSYIDSLRSIISNRREMIARGIDDIK